MTQVKSLEEGSNGSRFTKGENKLFASQYDSRRGRNTDMKGIITGLITLGHFNLLLQGKPGERFTPPPGQ